MQRGHRPWTLPGTGFLISLVPPSWRSQDSLILIFLAASIYGHDIKSPFKKHSLSEKVNRLRENIK